MEAAGYEVKRGKFVSFRAPGQERFTRSKTLGEAYTVEAITERIAGDIPGEAESVKAGKSGYLHADRYTEQYQGSGKQGLRTMGEDTQLEAGGKDFEFPNGA